MSGPLTQLSMLEMARRLRSGELGAEELCEAHIARIEVVNPALNAVVRTRFGEARAAARDADRRRAAGERDLPPFLGVPFTAKEHLSIAGLPNTGGLLRRRDKVATRDATVVRRMREAGFILLGTTNVPEGLTWYETYNKVYGRTNNPHDVRAIPGGSSGGEAAIIAAGGSPIGLGGDMGGSIRLPAFFCGIAGHKPSGGRIPESGAWPGARGQIGRFKVLGPMARTIADLRAVLPVLEGPDGLDPTVDAPAFADREVDARALRVLWFDDNGIMAPSDDVRGAVRASVRALEARGASVTAWRPRAIKRSIEMWATALAESGGPKFSEVIADGEGLTLLADWLKWPLRRSQHTLPVLGLLTIEKALGPFERFKRQTSLLREELQREIEDALGDDGVLVCPVFHRAAPRHGLEAVRHFLGFSYSGALNPLELPSTAVPTGLGREGLPVGVQVAARRQADALTLRVAEWIEQDLGGYRAPTLGVKPENTRSRPASSVVSPASSRSVSVV